MFSFLKFRMDTDTVDKCICFYGLEVQVLIKAQIQVHKSAFRFVDSKLYSSAGADLKMGIKMATENYTNMVADVAKCVQFSYDQL